LAIRLRVNKIKKPKPASGNVINRRLDVRFGSKAEKLKMSK
jgi:hypothetical protein